MIIIINLKSMFNMVNFYNYFIPETIILAFKSFNLLNLLIKILFLLLIFF